MSESVHIPVLLQEVLHFLNPVDDGIYIDGTLGGGGHTEAICRKAGCQGGSGISVVAFDRDIEAINRTEHRLRTIFAAAEKFPVRFVHADYRFFDEALDMLKISQADGFLLDLGLSSDQLADRKRGFSFDSDGELDMRFDTSEGLPAAELLQTLPENEIARIIYEYGEERHSRKIARRITANRENGAPLRTARQLADLVRCSVPPSRYTEKHTGKRTGGQTGRHSIDPATRTFQALRIAVNDELGALTETLQKLPERLAPGGIAAVISFHSLEDRIVKNAFRNDDRWEILTPKPVCASETEIARNPRSRSAKLRAAKRRAGNAGSDSIQNIPQPVRHLTIAIDKKFKPPSR